MHHDVRPIRVGFYTPANLNLIDGSAIWVQSVAETLHVDPRVDMTIPLKVTDQRDVVTGLLRRLDRVRLIPPAFAKPRTRAAMTHDEALDLLERLDAAKPFDILLLRAYELCLAAVKRERFRGRLWSCYILEPEKDIASADYIDGMAEIARGSQHVVCQSEEMRALFESLVPGAIGRTILLPPAIPASTVTRPDPDRIVRRMIYTGKFHRFYPVPEMIGFFADLRTTYPDLEFHVAGDKIHRPPDDPGYAPQLERMLSGTEGLIWHGGIGRDAVERLLAGGGIALSLWDHRYGSEMNDLVISTKLLDYCSVGLPVILNRTAAQEAMLGPDYPLFVERSGEALPLLRRLLEDVKLYRDASARTYAATRRFTYPAVMDRVRPYLVHASALADPATRTSRDDHAPTGYELADLDRPKLPGAALNLGFVSPASDPEPALDQALELLALLRATDERFRLIVRRSGTAAGESAEGSGSRSRLRDRLTATGRWPELVDGISIVPGEDDLPSWLRTVGFLVAVGQPADVGPSLAAAAASGSVPVHIAHPVPIAGWGSLGTAGGTNGWVGGSADEAATAIAEMVLLGGWAERADRLRAEAHRPGIAAGVRPSPEAG
jgi:glycosyltransferase involved in cell wall biosynthesis